VGKEWKKSSPTRVFAPKAFVCDYFLKGKMMNLQENQCNACPFKPYCANAQQGIKVTVMTLGSDERLSDETLEEIKAWFVGKYLFS
jgi:hypothetical protein